MPKYGILDEALFRLVAIAGKALMHFIRAAVTGELENREVATRVRASGRRIIYAFWHNRLMIPIITHRNRGIGILISSSRDGEYVARIAGKLGFHVIRGSTTRGGEEGFRKLVTAIDEGHDVAITPDGPTGPVYEVKKGIVYLARASGAAIIPVGMTADRYKALASWDSFRVLLPGAYVLARYGEPIIVPEHANKHEMEAIRARLEADLKVLNADVESRVREARLTRGSRPRYQGE